MRSDSPTTTPPAGHAPRSSCSEHRPTRSSRARTTETPTRAFSAAATCSSTVSASRCRSRDPPSGQIPCVTSSTSSRSCARTTCDGSACSAPSPPARRHSRRRLADAFGTVWAAEFGHYYQALGRDDPNAAWDSGEFTHVARLHAWLEDFQASQANGVVFCDTDAFTTTLWHETFVGTEAPADVLELARTRRYDLYLLCDMDIPFRQDAYELRDDGPRRAWMQARFLERLNGQTTPWILPTGTLDERLATAAAAVRPLLA